jgi:rod shape-determining protein MreB and related proteins
MIKFLNKEIAIDLGTANTLVIQNNNIILDEPTMIAYDINNKIIGIGLEAKQMEGKVHENIRTIRPLKDGVIANFTAAEEMLRGMIKKVSSNNRWVFPALRMIICIPAGTTEVEKRAVRDSAEMSGAKEIYLLHEPLAAAMGIGLDITEPRGNMIIDIGGGTTEIAVIALSGIIAIESTRVAGDSFDADIIHYIRKQYNMSIGKNTAEQIKIALGSALPEISNPPGSFPVRGRDLVTGTPKEVMISYPEIALCLDKSISKIEESVMKLLEATPPEVASDIYHNGIYLTGGGALLRGIDKRISNKTKLPVTIPEDPLLVVAKGTGLALKKLNSMKFLMQ